MNYKLYRPSDLEQSIAMKYKECGVNHPSDLCIESIADIFEIELRTYEGKPFVYWDENFFAFIFLSASLDRIQMREVFFHELSHPIQHIGNQTKMPLLMKQLQENQAKQFELYAAMPFYLLEPFFETHTQDYSYFVGILSEEFKLSIPFIQRRLDQIQLRIITESDVSTDFPLCVNIYR